MRTNKRAIIVILSFFTLSVLAFGITKKTFIKTGNQTLSPEQAILGIWVLENDPTTKIEFTSNGEEKWYENNVLKYTDTYSISNECGGQTYDGGNGLYLKEIDGQDGTELCTYINGINENNSNVLSLTDDNGRLIIYIKQ